MSFFFFKQKTAYEMRISDWSSDVCSSDLFRGQDGAAPTAGRPAVRRDEAPHQGRRCERAAEGRRLAVLDRVRDRRAISQMVAQAGGRRRSEEHTSELQSLMRISYAVF